MTLKKLLRSGGLLLLAWLAAGAAKAQPFQDWLQTFSTASAYVEVPDSAQLHLSNTLTFEAWVAINATGGCRSIAGKSYVTSWWVGVCGTTLRSYRSGHVFDGGQIPAGAWTHVAVVIGGGRRKHYIDGELALDQPDPGSIGVNSSPLRLWSDVAWEFTPQGALDEVRLWRGARTQAQIRQFITQSSVAGQPNLVGHWTLNGSAAATPAALSGVEHGTFIYDDFHGGDCFPTSNVACLLDRFAVSAVYRGGPVGTPATAATVQQSSPKSAVFSTSDPQLWEVLVNAVNLCPTGGRPIVAVSSPSSYFRKVSVLDDSYGVQRIYFLYPGGVTAPILDATGFTGCP